MRLNILIGGEAGQGPNFLAEIIARGLIAKGYNVFTSRDYQSLIRGGHNFNLLSFSDKPIASNSNGVDILIPLDDKTESIHRKELNKKCIILEHSKSNVFYAGCIYKILDLDFKVLKNQLQGLKNFDKNLKEAIQGFNSTKQRLKIPPIKNKRLGYIDGSQAVAQGAIASKVETYYAYPMTPATGVMVHLAQSMKNPKNKHLVVELENEIGVINAACGSAVVGSKAMLGTSGGGFDLMTEALSMTGIAEIPLVIYLASRVGPGTGAATYKEQGDLKDALYAGHGEFPRVVIAPGDAKEAIELTTQAFYFSQKFKIPCIILSDKHLAEAKYSFINNPKLTKPIKTVTKPEKFHSYTHNSQGIAVEDAEGIIKAKESLIKKQQLINKESKKFQTYKLHGRKQSKNLVIGWGSTKGAVLDAITENNLDCKFLQILYLKPFSSEIRDILRKHNPKKIFVIENNSTSQLSCLIAHKACISIPQQNKILKYNGSPFTSTEVADKLKKVLK